MNASEAREKTNEIIKSNMENLFRRINNAIEDQNFKIEVNEELCNFTQIKILRDLNYKVDWNEFTKIVTISWAD